jgi:hypothetical protein
MLAWFRGTSSRSARLERGRALPGTRPATAPASSEPFVEVRDAQGARESRMQTPRMAGTSQQRPGGWPARASLGTP